MLDYSRGARQFAEGRTRDDLDTDRQLCLALVKAVEIVGEAATRVPTEERSRWPAIPWSDLVGMRNRLVHGYDVINLDILWQTIQEDLPALIAVLEAGFASESEA